MPSRAYRNLGNRLRDLDQLMQAHTAITQFRRARRAARSAGGSLAQISAVIGRLVSPPGPGRRAQVGALNRAAMVLLSAHLQGYIEELHAEAAQSLLGKVVNDVASLVDRAQQNFSNPRAYRIEQLFRSLGMPNVLNNVGWQRASNRSVRKRLNDYVETRNRIAHGSQERTSKAKVWSFKRFVQLFAEKFDEKVRNEIRTSTGKSPW